MHPAVPGTYERTLTSRLPETQQLHGFSLPAEPSTINGSNSNEQTSDVYLTTSDEI
ncbi:hypothetical protein C791_0864 [Amycolatopsis azurea DSM 43854]|uniref:Uncharacterized protein n=1 Tax=Amycolatopsis azurea DSM 43854 TaxID=1238180 RepID=M2QRQ0_9PSEU|nr:hypothetical protein C791_0864 [Amycolatopsis azurea DSM 43854]